MVFVVLGVASASDFSTLVFKSGVSACFFTGDGASVGTGRLRLTPSCVVFTSVRGGVLLLVGIESEICVGGFADVIIFSVGDIVFSVQSSMLPSEVGMLSAEVSVRGAVCSVGGRIVLAGWFESVGIVFEMLVCVLGGDGLTASEAKLSFMSVHVFLL